MGYAYIAAGGLSAVILFYYLASKKFREPDLKVILLIPVLVFGFTFYLAGYLPALIGLGTAGPMRFGDVMSGVSRALASTIQMLGGENGYEVIAKNGGYFSTYGYIIPFWATHFVAVLVTIMAAITVFGRTLATKFRQLKNHTADTYVLYGVNVKSLCFGQNLMSGDSCGNIKAPRRFVVFIDENADLVSRETISRMGAVLLGEPMFDCSRLNTKALVKAGLTNKRKNKYLFAFTDSDVINFSIASGIREAVAETMLKPDTLKGVYIYTDQSVVVDELEAKKYSFNYFTAEELAVRLLFNAHPIYQRLSFDAATGLPECGKRRACITLVILGFGSTGCRVLQQALLSGQFVGCAFEAVIIDRQADELKGAFINKHPVLFDKKSCCDIDISFQHAAAGSSKTYETLDTLLKKNGCIDYLISCLGNDDLNFKVISDLRQYLVKSPTVRANMPVLAAHSTDKKYQLFANEEGLIGKISVFGDYDALFTHGLIVNEELDVLAKAVDQAAYGGSDWSALPLHEKNSNRAAASNIGAYLHMMGLELVSNEDEKILREKGIGYQALTQDQFEALLKNNMTLLDNLGRSEHLRWNVFHYARGWETKPLHDISNYSGRKDPRSRTHACLVGWEDLNTVRDHIVNVSKKAGLSREKLEVIEENCQFQTIDKNNISKIFNILTLYNSQVGEGKQLHIIRRN